MFNEYIEFIVTGANQRCLQTHGKYIERQSVQLTENVNTPDASEVIALYIASNSRNALFHVKKNSFDLQES